jgi:transketolase
MDVMAIITFLSPFLPFLIKFGEKSAETAGSKFGEDAWNKAKKIWDKLHPAVAAKEDAKSAFNLVSTDPDDEDYRKVFQKQLKKLLDEDQELTAAIAQIMPEELPATSGTTITQTITNNDGQAIAQMTNSKAIGKIEGGIQGSVNF